MLHIPVHVCIDGSMAKNALIFSVLSRRSDTYGGAKKIWDKHQKLSMYL
jgi:hypothetical protein